MLAALGVAAVCVWSSDLIALGIKAATDRPRPFEDIAEPGPLITATVGSSFPSGHAATSFAGAVVLATAVRRAAPALFVLAGAIAFSRVYVGVHYPSDVLAGMALGSLVALVVLRVRSRRRLLAGLPRSGGRRRRG
jgi:undecaprenyl-diphosphatase